MNKIKVGIVGFGMSAQVFHVPFLEANNHFKITKILERNSEKSRLLYPNIDVVKSLDQLVLDEQIDLIVVTTPNLSHYEIVKRSLLNNKHVIVEKPFTVNVQQADELIEIAQKKKLVLSVYHNRRFDGGFLTLKKVIEDDLIGQVVEYEAHFDRFRNYIKDSWREAEEKGSGIVYDLGSHLIDQALYLFGLPKTVWADIRIQRENAKTADNFEIILGYEKLKVTLKASMLVREQSPHLAIHGTKGSYVKYGLDPQEEL
ncbi:MAG: Gfo/Idh/MocA family oxidoreductase, partial [Candidatus Sericytochromatia bacterium]|nr:Gfo/Idh/MocA family oxidoreductase [Candidatus Sericytochromatia bacterium]